MSKFGSDVSAQCNLMHDQLNFTRVPPRLSRSPCLSAIEKS